MYKNFSVLINKKIIKFNKKIRIPEVGDKSCSIRALIFASQCIGKSTIKNLLESEDVLNCVEALKTSGVKIIRSHKGLYYTKCREENKHLYEIFKEYIGIYWKDIIFNELTQVQLNKNFRIPPHKDAQNVGDSLLIGFGDYEGGEINIKKDDEIITHDIRDKGIIFNGALYEHYVNDFILLNNSNRYSMVIFNDKSLKREKI